MNFHNSLAAWSQWGWPLLVNHLWQATLFAALVWVAVMLLKRGPARARHVLWLIAATKFLLPSSLLLFLAERCGLHFSSLVSAVAPAPRSAEAIFQVAEQITQPITVLTTSVTVTPTHHEIYCALTVVWLLGATALLLAWLKRRHQFVRAVNAGRRMEDNREAAIFERVRLRLKVKREVALVTSPRITELGVWRLWRPIIVLPEGMAERLSDEELEAVLMHELIHVRRWDNLFGTLQMLLCCALWFHPLVWLLDRWLLAERELVCDEKVIEHGGAPQLYAGSLWKVVQFGLGWPMAGVSRAASSNLRRRIEQMMIADRPTRLSLWHRMLISAAVLMLLALSMVTGLLTRGAVSAQDSQIRESQEITLQSEITAPVVGNGSGGVASSVQGGVSVGVGGSVGVEKTNGVAVAGGSEQSQSLKEKIAQAPSLAMRFENADDAPLVITQARIKLVKDDAEPRASGLQASSLIQTQLSITNQTDRKITGVGLKLQSTGPNGTLSIYSQRAYLNLNIEPHAVTTFGDDQTIHLTASELSFNADDFVVKVVGVQFEEPPHWGLPLTSANKLSVNSELMERAMSEVRAQSSSGTRTLQVEVSDGRDPDRIVSLDSAFPPNGITPPKILYKERAGYTPEARAHDVQGTVLLSVVFRVDGTITDIKVLHPLPAGLTEKAIEAAQKIRFLPATKDGQPLSVRANVEYSFLKDK